MEMLLQERKGENIISRHPLVTILVLGYNSRRWLGSCLKSLLATRYENLQIIYLDNASSDGSVEFVREHFPGVKVMENGGNLGFARGNNRGIKAALAAGSDFVGLLNPDTVVGPGWLSALVKFMESHPEFGVVGPVQYEYGQDGWERPNAWSVQALEDGNRDLLHVWEPPEASARTIQSLPDDAEERFAAARRAKPGTYFEYPYVQGSAFLARREVFEIIGLFDELYGNFYEETSFCRKVRMSGFRIGIVYASRVQHKGGGMWSGNAIARRRRNYYYSRNKYVFLITDPERNWARKCRILWKWFLYDLRDAVGRQENISSLGQLVMIYLWLLWRLPALISRLQEGAALRHQPKAKPGLTQ